MGMETLVNAAQAAGYSMATSGEPKTPDVGSTEAQIKSDGERDGLLKRSIDYVRSLLG